MDLRGNNTVQGNLAVAGTLTPAGITTLARVKHTVQTIDMADATHTLILSGTAGANQTLLTGDTLIVDPNSGGASENLVLPTTASCTGIVLTIFNGGGEGIVVKDSATNTVTTIPTGKGAMVGCNGSGWGNILGA